MSKTKSLQELLHHGETFVAPGVYDGWTASLVQEAGFPACAMTGFGVAGSMGYPDIGLVTQLEMTQRVEQLCRVLTIPMIVDADTGHGGPNNVARTTRDFANAGASGMHLEDQPYPTLCSPGAGKRLTSIAEMQERIAAAVAARPSKNFVVVARTDAAGVTGIDDAVARGCAYLAAGADVTFVYGLKDDKGMRRYGREVAGAKLICISAAETAPRWSVAELADAGYSIIGLPANTLMIAAPAVRNFLRQFKQSGDVTPMLADMDKVTELNRLMKLDQYVDFEASVQGTVARLGAGLAA
ncbi:oxaloacetate decarboxylase [Hydrogenophaga sp.]|uniref:isocitrate lyase/PEP mutase family protein n=1 Tax=Hydrogenophaga sp. TaxID=1904254 RepID=UPI002716FB3F|nr:isocitrate lyase/PEP mutase family protein [Hydrogenophaga sp.]MDO9436996.1 isocitrate lyase/PEP mutase family protein [Hydrogenophaga sp.]